MQYDEGQSLYRIVLWSRRGNKNAETYKSIHWFQFPFEISSSVIDTLSMSLFATTILDLLSGSLNNVLSCWSGSNQRDRKLYQTYWQKKEIKGCPNARRVNCMWSKFILPLCLFLFKQGDCHPWGDRIKWWLEILFKHHFLFLLLI